MSWSSLPPEIHDHILDLFCEDIITEYSAIGSRKNLRRHNYLLENENAAIMAPGAKLTPPDKSMSILLPFNCPETET